MPHCLLEYSNNVIDPPDLRALLADVNQALAGTGLFALDAIKSRAIVHEQYAVGDGASDRAFVAMNVSIFAGRDDETKARIAASVLRVIEPYFAATTASMRCDITVRITDMHRASYAKSTGPR